MKTLMNIFNFFLLELGHNMQRDEWTFDGSTEVTVNLFSMHAMMRMLNLDLTEIKWLRDQASSFADYFRTTPNYSDWQNNFGLALVTFAQLIKHFGWQPMYTFMKNYEIDIANEAATLPVTNQDKIDQWVVRYSQIINLNIKPQFEMFGLSVSDAVDAELSHLSLWSLPKEKQSQNFFAKKNLF